jgi:pimeloyl-ACP methyl ester carboxylesterase
MGLSSILYSVAKWSLYVTVSASFGLLTLLYFNQTKLIYPSTFPEGSRTSVSVPSEYGMNQYDDLYLTTKDKVKLHCYYIKNGSNKTLIYFHANAGNMGHRLPIAAQLMRVLGCNVFMVSYRGYGKSGSTANEKGMKIDAQTVFDYVLDHKMGEKFIIYGQSIGGAVAIDLASKNTGKIQCLIIENTFLSLVFEID